jgi:hypothetical protein
MSTEHKFVFACGLCGARVNELRRGRCWGCYSTWADQRAVGKGAACVVCDERRRDNLRMVEVHGRSLPMCHLCGFRTNRLEPVPVTIEGLRVMLRRDRRATDRRAGAMDTRVFPRERRDDERRRPPRELAPGAYPEVNTLPVLNLYDVLELDVDDIDILEATTVALDPRAAVAALADPVRGPDTVTAAEAQS